MEDYTIKITAQIWVTKGRTCRFFPKDEKSLYPVLLLDEKYLNYVLTGDKLTIEGHKFKIISFSHSKIAEMIIQDEKGKQFKFVSLG